MAFNVTFSPWFNPNNCSIHCRNNEGYKPTDMFYSDKDYFHPRYYRSRVPLFPTVLAPPLFKQSYWRKSNLKKMKPQVFEIEDYFDSFYSFLEGIMLTPTQLMKCGFPIESCDIGKAHFTCSRDENGPGPSNLRICCRCRSDYNIIDNDFENACVFHPQKPIFIDSNNGSYPIYPCCNAEKGSVGCTSNNFHVSTSKCRMDDDFITTSKNDFIEKNIVILDTEMCYTKKGMEITQVTLLSFDGSLLYETYVEPDFPIIDYNTQFSGITAEMLENTKVRIEEVRESLLNIINKNTIIIGHGLENDLKALRFIHKKIVDTSVLFPDCRGFPFRSKLSVLSEKYLRRGIQLGKHDSKEDCHACLDLVILKFNGFLT